MDLGNGFTGLNHLNDISTTKDYSLLCGFSESEVNHCFLPEIENIAKTVKNNSDETRRA